MLRLIALILICISGYALDPAPRGNRILSVDINEGLSVDYGTTYVASQELGIDEINFLIQWSDYESTLGSMDLSVFELIESAHPWQNKPVLLTIAPLHHRNPLLPADLAGKSFADPAVISRFKQFLDAAMAKMPETVIPQLVIGSEIDIYLGADSGRWADYTHFYAEIAAHIHATYPDVSVGAEVTYGAFSSGVFPFLQILNGHSDTICLSYYPLTAEFQVDDLSVVGDVLDDVVSRTTKPIHCLQWGVPSSPMNGSSEWLQAEFVTATFEAWDRHKERVRNIDFTWTNDVNPALLAGWTEFFGSDNPQFIAFLSTLGLRQTDGEPKLAWYRLKTEARARGWGDPSAATRVISIQVSGGTGPWLIVHPASGTIASSEQGATAFSDLLPQDRQVFTFTQTSHNG